MSKIKILILTNGNKDDHFLWEKACINKQEIVDYKIVDITKNSWYENITAENADIYLTKPEGFSSSFKQLYDERIGIINLVLKKNIYPSLQEILIYENKRFLSFWLKANQLPHPKTEVFYDKQESIDFINHTVFPVVAKINIGASGSGVKILYNLSEAINYIEEMFSEKGKARKWGPNWKMGNWGKRIKKYMVNPNAINEKLKYYARQKKETQKGFVLFQEYIPHSYEWRCVKINDSFFAHKKIAKGEKTSGALVKGYEIPSEKLLYFIKNITDTFQLQSQAIDLFETKDGKFLINEMQCFFGQSDPYQMLINGKPGRYKFINEKWVFEEGDFCTNECFDLRLEHALSLLKK